MGCCHITIRANDTHENLVSVPVLINESSLSINIAGPHHFINVKAKSWTGLFSKLNNVGYDLVDAGNANI